MSTQNLESSTDDQARLKGGINSVEPTEAINHIDDLTCRIILKELELERFNLRYKKKQASKDVGEDGAMLLSKKRILP